MSNKSNNEQHEAQFDFGEAKDLTVGQAIRKNEEVEAGVLPEDSILDKYIKQHREEIEADKFETRQFKKEELLATQTQVFFYDHEAGWYNLQARLPYNQYHHREASLLLLELPFLPKSPKYYSTSNLLR